ncbi:hypothetical protein ABZ897_54810 [Nonomuraea sp. NPDC046802]|uniref:hypothetical protein n=1 Tax=Nonomuraea sp. NPDC046802 TaxID=3154919 RepID=UPI0033E30FA7
MINEDLRTARRRARRRDELTERHAEIIDLVQEARKALDAVDVWDQESVSVAEARLGALTVVLTAVEQELAAVGPAQDLYEELLVREERRVAASADPRGAELLEINRLLSELDVELPARQRARAAGTALLHAGGGACEAALTDFAQRLKALGMTVEPASLRCHGGTLSGHAQRPGGRGHESGGRGRKPGGEGRRVGVARGAVERLVRRLEERCQELEGLRHRLRARREELLIN